MGAVDVVPAAFALGFEDVVLGVLGGGGEGEGGGVREGELRGECGAEGLEGGRRVVGEVVGEVVGGGGGEELLDFLAAGEVQEDGGAFGGAGAFEVVARGPDRGVGVFGGGVEGAEVDGGYFVRGGGAGGGCVDEGARGVVGGDGGGG